MASYKLKNSKKIVSLTQNDYLTEGGEGKIYVKGDIAYKIYFDGKEPPEKKLNELSLINHKNVITPNDILLDSKTNKYVGSCMRFLNQKEYFSAAQLIPNAFWQRNHLTHNSISRLIEHFSSVIKEIHNHKILLVDINEFNFLVNKVVTEIFCIDTNSYQTPHCSATAIMESVRDWQNNGFSELTDWFSFAILTFYIYTGIHPFRGGSCANLTGSLDENTKHRILNNISVFNSKVKYPNRAVREFKLIPKNWYDWYYNEFEKGQRTPPPNTLGQIAPITQKTYDISSDSLVLTEINKYDEEIIRLSKIGGQRLVITKSHVYLDNSKYLNRGDNYVVYDNMLNSVKIVNNRLDLNGFRGDFQCDDFFISNNTIYAKSENKLCRVLIKNNKYLVLPVSEISSLTGKCYGFQDGFVIENLAGETYFVLVNDGASYQIRLTELNKHAIIEADKSGDYIAGYSRKNNTYYYFIVKLKDFKLDNIQITKVNGPDDLTFIQHKNGFMISLFNDDLILTSGNKNKIVKDKFFSSGSVQFIELNGEMYFSKGDILFTGKLK